MLTAMYRSAAVFCLLAVGCSPNEAGGTPTPGDAATTTDADASARDATIDAPHDERDIAVDKEPDAVPTSDGPATDTTGEPAIDGDRPDRGNAEDGAFDVADARSEMDRSADRCGNALPSLSVWPRAEVMAADGSDDVDGTSSDVRDGASNDARDSQRDGSDDSRDGPKDGDKIPQCDALQADWRTFVSQNRDCTANSDCVVVAGAGSCECAPPWGPRLGHPIGVASGDAINATAQNAAQTYLARWDELECNLLDRYCVFDAGPAKNLRCEVGKCTIDWGACNLPPPMPEPCR